MDSSIFDAYQEEFVKNTSDFRSFIEALKESGSNVDRKRASVQACDEVVGKIANLLKEMEIEVRTYPSQLKRTCNETLNGDKDEFTSLKAEYNSAKFAAEKASLTSTQSGKDRARMIEVNEKINDQNLLLERVHRTVAETEEIGEETIKELGRNREAIESARSKAQETNSMADGISKTLKRMTNREWSLGFWA